MIGEIGGTAEEEAAEFLKNHKIKKPMVGFIAELPLPQEEEWGMLVLSFQEEKGGAEDKIETMQSAE